MRCKTHHCTVCSPLSAVKDMTMGQLAEINKILFVPPFKGSIVYHPEELTKHEHFESFTREALR